MSKFPTTIYAELTPNPNTMKFAANRLLIEGGKTVEFTSKDDTRGFSNLADDLFNFPFITGVFIASNFVTLTKNDSIGWELVNMQLRDFIREHLELNQFAVQKLPEAIVVTKKTEAESSEKGNSSSSANHTEIDQKIISLLDEYVKPAVESDGGAIDFESFNEGIVTVVLKGACSGCPSSTITLKQGIESMLKNTIPEVTEVVAKEG
jgi:Fe-S cluster biogenesis protein NfuA